MQRRLAVDGMFQDERKRTFLMTDLLESAENVDEVEIL